MSTTRSLGAVAAEVAGMDLHGPSDALTPAQATRLAAVVGEYKAMRAALDAGASVAQLETQEWLVDVHLL